jgi:hypothetical protein
MSFMAEYLPAPPRASVSQGDHVSLSPPRRARSGGDHLLLHPSGSAVCLSLFAQ